MGEHAFALLGNGCLARIGALVREAVEEWAAAWGAAQVPVQVSCTRAWEALPLLPSLAWRQRHDGDGRSLWLAWQSDLDKQLRRLVFPSDHHGVGELLPGSIGAQGGFQALVALARQLAQLASLDAVAAAGAAIPPPALFGYGAGALLVTVRLGEQSLSCLFNHASVAMLDAAYRAPAAPALAAVDLRRALAATPIQFPVALGQAEVALGSLLTLGAGDVIRLGVAVDQPLRVCAGDGDLVCQGYLGKVDGGMALELVAPTH